jgi:general secretion pathway protein H
MTLRAGNNGFTLIEIIIVLTIIGLALSVVAIATTREYSKSIIRSEVRKIYAALKHARETAITRKSEVIFETEEENKGYTITANESQIFRRKLPEGITIYSESVIFYPMGDSTGGTILVNDEDERKYEVQISNITGRPKVQWIQSY